MKHKQGLGSTGFEEEYWNENYSKLSEMDGIFNAKAHAKYLKASFDLEYVDVHSLIDFGAGYGHLLKAFVEVFKPDKAIAIEPSSPAFNKLKKRKIKVGSMQLSLYQNSMLDWLENNQSLKPFDLGICTSVLQYCESGELKKVVPLLSKCVRYLYLTLPIDLELKKQSDEYNFKDRFALSRSQKFYHEIFSPYFTFVGNRILESRNFYDYKNTNFTELLFRF